MHVLYNHRRRRLALLPPLLNHHHPVGVLYGFTMASGIPREIRPVVPPPLASSTPAFKRARLTYQTLERDQPEGIPGRYRPHLTDVSWKPVPVATSRVARSRCNPAWVGGEGLELTRTAHGDR
jgi:hypothetical protein